MRKIIIVICSILAALLIGFGVWANCTQSGIRTMETWKTNLQHAKDDTNYETKKQVEDTCRAMIAEYNTDVSRYNLYKDSQDSEKQRWAEESYMRACETANKYNEYILKNSFVWKNNVPDDIKMSLSTPTR